MRGKSGKGLLIGILFLTMTHVGCTPVEPEKPLEVRVQGLGGGGERETAGGTVTTPQASRTTGVPRGVFGTEPAAASAGASEGAQVHGAIRGTEPVALPANGCEPAQAVGVVPEAGPIGVPAWAGTEAGASGSGEREVRYWSRLEGALAAPVDNPGEVSEGQMRVAVAESRVVALPLAHTSVEAETTGFMSRVYVTQYFTNPFDHPIEAVYVFPLPQLAAVDDMEMVIGERLPVAPERRTGAGRGTSQGRGR
jgi:hypothetical protein